MTNKISIADEVQKLNPEVGNTLPYILIEYRENHTVFAGSATKTEIAEMVAETMNSNPMFYEAVKTAFITLELIKP